jgi:hypothetical protein
MSRESPPLSAALPKAPKNNYAASVKAIMHARHANTRRKIKRPPSTPWIGEMIVVKEYDQMDSLREVLQQPARQKRLAVEESGFTEHLIEESVFDEECREGGLKRKREESDDESPESPRQQNTKKRKVMSDAGNHSIEEDTQSVTTPEKMQLDIAPGKENIPPEVLYCTG